VPAREPGPRDASEPTNERTPALRVASGWEIPDRRRCGVESSHSTIANELAGRCPDTLGGGDARSCFEVALGSQHVAGRLGEGADRRVRLGGGRRAAPRLRGIRPDSASSQQLKRHSTSSMGGGRNMVRPGAAPLTHGSRTSRPHCSAEPSWAARSPTARGRDSSFCLLTCSGPTIKRGAWRDRSRPVEGSPRETPWAPGPDALSGGSDHAVVDGYPGTTVTAHRMPGARLNRASAVSRSQPNNSANAT
jgi:hypothetical protein